MNSSDFDAWADQYKLTDTERVLMQVHAERVHGGIEDLTADQLTELAKAVGILSSWIRRIVGWIRGAF